MNRSNRRVLRPRYWIMLACAAVIAGVCMAPVFAVAMLARALDAALSGLGNALFGGLLAEIGGALMAVLLWIAYAFWVILGYEWSQLIWLLLALFGWLLSAGAS